MEVAPDTLYTTVWSDPPTLSAYRISRDGPCPTISLLRTVPSTSLSGYVCSGRKVMYSACGPQVDVFELDEGGGLSDRSAVQTFKLREEQKLGSGAQMDFGGLRHGGHVSHSASMSAHLRVVTCRRMGRNSTWPTCECLDDLQAHYQRAQLCMVVQRRSADTSPGFRIEEYRSQTPRWTATHLATSKRQYRLFSSRAFICELTGRHMMLTFSS